MEEISKNLYANWCGGNQILGWAVESCVFVQESCGLEASTLEMQLESLGLFAWCYLGDYAAWWWKSTQVSWSVPMNIDVTCNSEDPVSELVLASSLVPESQEELNY